MNDHKKTKEKLIRELEDLRKKVSGLELQIDQAGTLDSITSEVLAQISHEIRTPVNTILSFANLIYDELEEQLDDEIKSDFNIISRAGKRIIRTIDLIINISEAQSGTYEYNEREFDLYSRVLESLHAEFYHQAKVKNIEFDVIKDTDNTTINADHYTVNQIFDNLIDNAIKYTAEGLVEVRINRNKEDNLAINVIDTGIGISEEYMPNLYKPFTQEDDGYRRKYEGNGLGLVLVKSYCDLNKAKIKIESEKGIGTTVTVVFKT